MTGLGMFLYILLIDIALLIFDRDRARNAYNILACVVMLAIAYAAWRM